MLNCQNVGELIHFFGIEKSLCQQVETQLGEQAHPLLVRLWTLPLKRSHAVTRFGSYSCQGEYPRAIRLQFAQEEHQLRQTFLHEIAHFLDHQTRKNRKVYRSPHGLSWQHWLKTIGGELLGTESAAMTALYQQKLKPIARCKRCGVVLKRLSYLSKGRTYLHRNCGGTLTPLGPRPSLTLRGDDATSCR